MMKAWQHFKTITTHKMWVMRYCFKIGLYWQGLTHDLSKYSPTEFLVGMKYYQGDRSPNNAEREDTGMSKSWMHHNWLTAQEALEYGLIDKVMENKVSDNVIEKNYMECLKFNEINESKVDNFDLATASFVKEVRFIIRART